MNLETWPSGISGDIQYESSEFMLKSANQNPSETALLLNENGAYGKYNSEYDKTKKGKYDLDEQRVCGDAIIAGIYKNDLAAIKRGLKIMKWGFNLQRPDGSSYSNNAYHSPSFFLAEASRAILHLKNSQYKNSFSSDLDSLTSSIKKTAEWLIKKEIEEPGLKSNEPYTHLRQLFGNSE